MDEIYFAHLTDIHMGSRLLNRFYTGPLAGLNGHDLLLCERLDFTFSTVIPTIEGLPHPAAFSVVVSGDLTRIGSSEDFAIAHTYLMGSWILDGTAGDRRGLALVPARILTVPGNHDQWEGKGRWPQPSRNPAIFPRHFSRTPWQRSLVSPSGRLRLDLLGVDSSSGLKARRNPSAEGAISRREFAGLKAQLGLRVLDSPDQHLVRAIICHHAFSNVNAPWTGPLRWKHVLRLVKVARQGGAAVVLTGHTHDFRHVRYPLGARPPRPWVTELRSAAALAGPALAGAQGFLVHRVSLAGNPPVPTWEYRKYQWNGWAFAPAPARINVPL